MEGPGSSVVGVCPWGRWGPALLPLPRAAAAVLSRPGCMVCPSSSELCPLGTDLQVCVWGSERTLWFGGRPPCEGILDQHGWGCTSFAFM